MELAAARVSPAWSPGRRPLRPVPSREAPWGQPQDTALCVWSLRPFPAPREPWTALAAGSGVTRTRLRVAGTQALSPRPRMGAADSEGLSLPGRPGHSTPAPVPISAGGTRPSVSPPWNPGDSPAQSQGRSLREGHRPLGCSVLCLLSDPAGHPVSRTLATSLPLEPAEASSDLLQPGAVSPACG